MKTGSAKKSKELSLRIRRQDGPGAPPYWDTFAVSAGPRMTIGEALDALALDPINRRGERVSPVAYTWGCVGPGCGSCTVLAGRRLVAACATPIAEVAPKRGSLALEPLHKLGVVRDLLTRGERIGRAIAALTAWLPAAELPAAELPAADAGPGGAKSADPRLAFALDRCTRCGACIEACPETRANGGFAGAAAIAASVLCDLHPAGAADAASRHAALTAPGGIHECGHAENCLEVCPEGLPLDDVLSAAARAATRSFWRLRRG